MSQPGAPRRGLLIDRYCPISQQRSECHFPSVGVTVSLFWYLILSVFKSWPAWSGKYVVLKKFKCVEHFLMFADHFFPLWIACLFSWSVFHQLSTLCCFIGTVALVLSAASSFLSLLSLALSVNSFCSSSIEIAPYLSCFSKDVWIWLFPHWSCWRNITDLLISYRIIGLATFSVDSRVNVEHLYFTRKSVISFIHLVKRIHPEFWKTL